MFIKLEQCPKPGHLCKIVQTKRQLMQDFVGLHCQVGEPKGRHHQDFPIPVVIPDNGTTWMSLDELEFTHDLTAWLESLFASITPGIWVPLEQINRDFQLEHSQLNAALGHLLVNQKIEVDEKLGKLRYRKMFDGEEPQTLDYSSITQAEVGGEIIQVKPPTPAIAPEDLPEIEVICGYRCHPFCSGIPHASDEDLALMVEGMESAGYDPTEPIVFIMADVGYGYEKLLLDGRQRLKAAAKANVKVTKRWFDPVKEGDPYTWVITKNVKRRHLTTGQKALSVTQLLKLEKQLAQIRKRKGIKTETKGRSSEIIAAKAGVGEQTVRRASKIEDQAPDLAAEVRGGRSINSAYQELQQRQTDPETQQLEDAVFPPKKVEPAPTLEIGQLVWIDGGRHAAKTINHKNGILAKKTDTEAWVLVWGTIHKLKLEWVKPSQAAHKYCYVNIEASKLMRLMLSFPTLEDAIASIEIPTQSQLTLSDSGEVVEGYYQVEGKTLCRHPDGALMLVAQENIAF